MKYIAVLGRLPLLSIAELESQFTEVKPLFKRGSNLRKNAEVFELATFESEKAPDISKLGGVQKIGAEMKSGFNSLISFLEDLPDGKITLGVSDFRKGASARRFFVCSSLPGYI